MVVGWKKKMNRTIPCLALLNNCQISSQKVYYENYYTFIGT